jgi:hypothetical protein
MTTILENYMSRKLVKITDPSRKGIRRGNPIGFSKVKYSAALISTLTNINLINLAEQVGGSTYGVIRVWRSHADFKECCSNIIEEFKAVLDFELLDIYTHLAEDFKNGRFHDHEELFEQLKDVDTYNKSIISHIADRLNHYLYELPNGQVAFYDMAYYLARYSGAPKLLELLIQLQARLKGHLLEEAIETLQQPEISDEEKGGVVIKLKRLTA